MYLHFQISAQPDVLTEFEEVPVEGELSNDGREEEVCYDLTRTVQDQFLDFESSMRGR